MKAPVVTTPDERTRGPGLTKLSRDHLEMIRRHYEHAPEPNVFAKGYRKLLAHYYNLLIPRDASVLRSDAGRENCYPCFRQELYAGSIFRKGRSTKPEHGFLTDDFLCRPARIFP